MTISAWIGFAIVAVCIIVLGVLGCFYFDKTTAKIMSIIYWLKGEKKEWLV